MKAIGIPRLSDDIAGISNKDAAKMSVLTKDKIYRGSGPVDLLIVVRKSPLGWVVLGATTSKNRDTNRIPNDPDDGAYLCPNDMLLGRASSQVPQGPFYETRNPRKRVEFIQQIVDSFWRRWTTDVLPLLVPQRKWNVDRRNVCVDDFVMVQDSNALRGKWITRQVIEVYPGQDRKVRYVKVKTPTGEYSRPITKIAVVQPAEGFE